MNSQEFTKMIARKRLIETILREGLVDCIHCRFKLNIELDNINDFLDNHCLMLVVIP